MSDESFLASPRSRFRAAMMLAVTADALQIIAFPLFAEGAISPLDDVLDFLAAIVLVRLLGWHWEFLPSLIAERGADDTRPGDTAVAAFVKLVL